MVNLTFSSVQGGMVEALSIYKKWKCYSLDYEGSRKLVFSLREPNSCLVKNNAIRIFTRNRGRDFKISGCFPDKCCSIVDSKGNEVAQVLLKINLFELRIIYLQHDYKSNIKLLFECVG